MSTADDGEDDYLSMTFDELKPAKESSIARTARLKREALERGRVASKAERAKQDEEKRSAGLATRLDSSNNRGAKLMAKMGFAGGALGAAGNQGREDPLELSLKLDRGGIGMDNEKKRKFREQMEANEAEVKRTKVSEDEYRERVRQEREDTKAESQWRGAMKVLEGLDDEKTSETPNEDTQTRHNSEGRRLKNISLLYRPLVRDRREAEQRRRDIKSLYDGQTRLDELVNSEQDAEDTFATVDDNVDDLHEEDDELQEYENLAPTERLDKVVRHLRSAFNYCFWCKHQYEDDTMDGCPGIGEDEHG